jgi:hypothetical protein
VPEDCFDSGGTTVSVQFLPAGEYTTESPERASGRRDETPSGNDQAAA